MLIVVGGGPAGFFAAVAAREAAPGLPVVLLEKGGQVLRKVRVSGGGRCNVTHACFEPRLLAANYPRGGRELIGPFHAFGPRQTIAWFEERGVPLKTEADGRVFPVSDSALDIVGCLTGCAERAGVTVRLRTAVAGLAPGPDGGLRVLLGDGQALAARRVVLASGGGAGEEGGAGALAADLGHTLVPAVPSLFTFTSDDPRLEGLAGVACRRAVVRVAGEGLPRRLPEHEGPLLVTHWGLSGPAVLGLSSRCAPELHAAGYRFTLVVDWCPDLSRDDLAAWFADRAAAHGARSAGADPPGGLPKRLWAALIAGAEVPPERRWAEIGRRGLERLVEALKAGRFPVRGMSPFKEEFVTCGGVSLREVDFKTMESRVRPGLHLAGETLDIDGLTGGFNFQAAWTTGWLAGRAAARA